MGDVGLQSFRDILGRYNLGEVTVKSDGKLDLYNHHQKLTIFNGRKISNETRLEARATFVRALETSLRAHYGNDGMLSEDHKAFMKRVRDELGLEFSEVDGREVYIDKKGWEGTPLERRTISSIFTQLDNEFADIKFDTSDEKRPTKGLEDTIDLIFTPDQALEETDRTPGFAFMKDAIALRGEESSGDRFLANILNNHRGRIVAFAKQVLQGLLATEKDRRSFQGEGTYTNMMKNQPMPMIAYALLLGYDRVLHPPMKNNLKPILEKDVTVGYEIASRTGTKIAGRYDRVGVDNRGREKVLLSVNFPESFQNIRHSPVRHDVRMTWEADFQEKYQSLAPATRKVAEEVQNI